MGNQIQKKTCTFEIDNFSQRKTRFNSPLFSSGNCNWYITVCPMGNRTSKHMFLYLAVPDPLSRPHYWSRNVTWFRFVVVNPSSVLRSKSFGDSQVFDKTHPKWGVKTDLRLSKLRESGFLVNDKLKIDVYIDVFSVRGGLDPNDQLPEKKNETVYVNGFQVLDSQVKSANWIFETYPETALFIRPQDPQLKTAYMNILLRIYETLYNSPLEKLTEAELSNVSKGLLDLTQAGFKLEWVREKLQKVSVERKKLCDYEAQAQELGKQLKSLELVMCNLKAEI